MKTKILFLAISVVLTGTVFAQTSEQALNAHRFVNNASAAAHVNESVHKNMPIKTVQPSARSFSEMNEHEQAIIAHSFMNNSQSPAHQRIIERHQRMLANLAR